MSVIRNKLIRVAHSIPALRESILPLLQVRTAASVSVEEALRAKKVSLRDLKPRPGVKANLRYYKKVRMYRVQEAHSKLKGVIPDEKLDEFLRQNANGYGINMYEEDRRKSWAKDEEGIYETLVGPNAVLWRQAESYARDYSSAAQGMGAKATDLMSDMSDIDIAFAGMMSGIISKYDVKKMVKDVRNVDGRPPEQLKQLIMALQAIFR